MTQSANRYSYTFNNPLNATDPGEFINLGDIFKAVVIGFAAWVTGGLALQAMGFGGMGQPPLF